MNATSPPRYLVTGASRGIGRAIAERLAAEGARIAGTATRAENLLGTQEAVEEAGGEFLAFGGDVADPMTAQSAVAGMVEAWGGVDGLVANAGITRDGLLMRMAADDFDQVVSTNLGGAFHFVKAVARPMMKQRAGRIVLVSSVVAITGNPGQANYCASKAGLHGLARSVACELGSRNIGVNVVAPGYIETDMTEELPEDARQAMLAKTVSGRAGTSQDVAGAVQFLLSPDSAYVTGQVLVVDGGLSLG